MIHLEKIVAGWYKVLEHVGVDELGHNRPFPSCSYPLFQSEAKYDS